MVEEIEDIVDWIKKYDFLKGVWEKYDNFDKSVEDDINFHQYYFVCFPIMKKLSYYTDEHNNFCMKLVRNFGHFSNNHEFLYHKTERCYDLNNWIYYSMKKYKISKEIITGCFDDYKFYMNNIGKEPLCIDYEYDNIYDDQIRIIKLKIFQSYMEIVKNIIIGNGPINNDLQNYVCECVKIYKELKNHYCPNGDTHHINGKDTCKMLNTLKNTYMSFIYNKSQKNYKIPSLNNVEIEYLAMCPQDNNRSELTSESHGISSESASLNGVRDGGTVGISSHGRGINDEANLFTSSTDDNVENKGSPMSRTVSTAVGTVAGASSILALLYKFSPGGNWIRSGFRGGTGRISSNLYGDVPNESLFDGLQGEDMSSHNMRYNIGYGSV